MERTITTTKDGSNTLYVPQLDEHYHSVHGAVQEAMHVFINMGLATMHMSRLKVLEIGFGTGLNAMLSLDFAVKNSIVIEYQGVEKYPVSVDEAQLMRYPGSLPDDQWHRDFVQMHDKESFSSKTGSFTFKKIVSDFYDFELDTGVDLIYFDAFGPRVQPDLWEKRMFEKMYDHLNKGGKLVTYCAKGQVRRDMESSGFQVERLPGPPGKREMLRATK